MEQKPKGDTRYLTSDGSVTDRLRSTLTDVLATHIETARFWSNKREKPVEDYAIRKAYVIGSVLEGNDLSDIDLLLIADKIDQNDYRFIKQVMAEVYFVNRGKISAVDVFVRPHDEYPEEPRFEITDQVQDLLDDSNARMAGAT